MVGLFFDLDQKKNEFVKKFQSYGPLYRLNLPQVVQAELAADPSQRGTSAGLTEGFSLAAQLAQSSLRPDVRILEDVHATVLNRPCDIPASRREKPIAPLTAHHAVMDPALIDNALDRLFEWLQADSFQMLHSIEQYTIALLRLYEIWPFESSNAITTHVFCSFFVVRDGFPIPLHGGNRTAFLQALDAGFLFATQEMNRHVAAALMRSLNSIEAVFRGP